jgi:plasmid stability protein
MEARMGDLLVRNIPEELRETLKMLANANHRSLSEEVGALLKKAIQDNASEDAKPFVSAADAFADWRARLDISDEEHRQWQEIVDNARKSLERPVPDFEW